MNLLERFPKYSPSSELDAYMMASVTGMRVDKEQRIMEVDVSSSLIIPKRYLFRIESEIQDVYKLNYFKILPKYPPEAFNDEYFEDLMLDELKLESGVCEYKLRAKDNLFYKADNNAEVIKNESQRTALYRRRTGPS